MKFTPSSLPDSWNEVDQLISLLRFWGINYLVGLDHTASPSNLQTETSPVVLIQRLARCDEYPRVRDASISLFLLHPELADSVLEALEESEPEVAEQIAVLTLAALYLQRLWFVRLTLALGHRPRFPEQRFAFLWQTQHLPPPACHYGKWSLLALQEFEQRRTGLPFTFTGDWQNQVDHLLFQEEAKRHRLVDTITLPEDEKEDEQECNNNMSTRPSVDKTAIESFLQQLGRTFRKPGRLYLVEGTALVHAGVRPGFTQDIDIQVSGANEGELIVAVQRLIQQMQINIEFASPADFIPLPSQWEMHAQYVGRYGGVDVFYFDFYSIALSKIERGNSRDIDDVKLLVQQGIITLKELDAAYREVLAQLGQGHYPRITPQRFSERYTAVRPLL
jgi:hypothetical protein